MTISLRNILKGLLNPEEYRFPDASELMPELELPAEEETGEAGGEEAPPEPDYALFIHGQPVSGMEPIQIVFLNSTGEQAHVLDIPHLERMTEGGAWEDVPYREQVGFCGTPSTMPPGGRIWSEDPAALWGTLEPGLYRLRYAVGPTEKTEGEAAGQFTVGAPEVCGLPLAEGA